MLLLVWLLTPLVLLTVLANNEEESDSFAQEKHLSSHPSALVVQFSSRYEEALDLFYVPRDPNNENEFMSREHEVLQKQFKKGSDEQTINTYLGHAFVFRLASDPNVIIKRVIMDRHIGQVMVLPTKSNQFLRIGDDSDSEFSSLEEYESRRDQFMREYYDRTGRSWKNFWPRSPVRQYFYDSSHIHQTHKVISHFPKWYPKTELLALMKNRHNITISEDNSINNDDNDDENKNDSPIRCVSIANRTDNEQMNTEVCRMRSAIDTGNVVFPHRYRDLLDSLQEPRKEEATTAVNNDEDSSDESEKWNQCGPDSESGMQVCVEGGSDPYETVYDPISDELFEIEVLCHEPRVFVVRNMLSDFECDHIIDVGKQKLKRSTVAESADVTLDRTSRTSWVGQKESEVIADVYARVANIVRIDTPMRVRDGGQDLVEQLQLVHYNEGDLYKSHVDYETTSPHSRFITFLMYLNTPGFGGGNTSFPRAHSDCSLGRRDGEDYFGLNPGRGSAVFFYNLHEDGNVDDKSLHYAEPPKNGTFKYMTNLWLWNPYFRK